MICSNFTFSRDDILSVRTQGNGPHQILLLHGFAASHRTWDDLAPLFATDDYTLHLLDLKGHGRSCKPVRGDFSPSHHAEIINAYISSHSLRDVTVIGHSFGGAVALLTALDCPHITRLILIGAPAFPQPMPEFMRFLCLPLIGPLTMTLLPARVIARQGLESVFYRRDRITERHIARYAAGYHGPSAARALSCTVRRMVPENFPALIDRYATLDIPVLLIWGEHDRIVPLRIGQRLLGELKHASLSILPDCGHNPHEENPEETSALIMRFLKHQIDKPSAS